MSAVTPIAIRLPNISGAFIAINIPLHINIPNNIITNAHPTKPNSSAKTEKIKSFCGSGKYKNFCLLCPSPNPNSPPDPIAYKLCITCHPVPRLSLHGSIKDVIL